MTKWSYDVTWLNPHDVFYGKTVCSWSACELMLRNIQIQMSQLNNIQNSNSNLHSKPNDISKLIEEQNNLFS